MFDPTDKCKLLQKALFDCHQHQTNQFDEEFYAKVMGEYSDITKELNSEQLEGEEIYNRNITLEEVEGDIARLKPGKSPGPDMFPTDLFIQPGYTLRSALHRLLSMSWEEGKNARNMEVGRHEIPTEGREDRLLFPQLISTDKSHFMCSENSRKDHH